MVLKASMQASIQALVKPTDKFSIFAPTDRPHGDLILKGDVGPSKACAWPVRPVCRPEGAHARHRHGDRCLTEDRYRFFGMDGVHPVIAVQERHEIPAGGGEAGIPCSCRASIALAYHPHPIIVAEQSRRDGDRGAVVDDDDLHLRVGLV